MDGTNRSISPRIRRLRLAALAGLAGLFILSGLILVSQRQPSEAAVPGADQAAVGNLSLSNDFIRGMSYNVFSRTLAGQALSGRALDQMKRAGVTWVSLIPNWYVKDLSSTTFKRHGDTPSDSSLRRFIRMAHDRGLKVMLKPHVDVESGEWRGEIGTEPLNKAAWFKNYGDSVIEPYAALAAEEGADAFVIGVEFEGLQGEAKRWRNLVSVVRRTYNGPLTYAANYDGYEEVGFWGKLDWVGIDGYFPLRFGSPDTPYTVEDLTTQMRARLQTIETWRGTHADPLVREMDVVFTEVGYTSSAGSTLHPADYNEGCQNTEVNTAEQRDAYRALFTAVAEESWLTGTFLWWWDNPSTDDYKPDHPDSDWKCFYTPRGKPAFNVLKDAYRD